MCRSNLETAIEMAKKDFVGYEVKEIEVVKANDTVLKGICITKPDTNVGAALYLPEGADVKEWWQNARKNFHRALKESSVDKASTSVEEIISGDYVRKNVVPRLVSLAANKRYLTDKPYKTFLDMAIIYSVNVTELIGKEMERADVVITKPLLEKIGMSVEELDVCAMKNLVWETDKFDFWDMTVISNKSRLYGASCILSDKFLQQIREAKGGDFIILPSSVHECIVFDHMEDAADKADELVEMVKSINSTAVSPEEKLTDNAYVYADGKVTFLKDYLVGRAGRATDTQSAAESE